MCLQKTNGAWSRPSRVETLWRTLFNDDLDPSSEHSQRPAPTGVGLMFPELIKVLMTLVFDREGFTRRYLADRSAGSIANTADGDNLSDQQIGSYVESLEKSLDILRSVEAAGAVCLPPKGYYKRLWLDHLASGEDNTALFDRCVAGAEEDGRSLLSRAERAGLLPLADCLVKSTFKPANKEEYDLWERRFGNRTMRLAPARLFRTTKQTLGLAKSPVRPGDEIWVLYGATVPFVLRPRAHNAGHTRCYEFMGEAYVHGIMDGEAVVDDDGTPDEITLI